MRIIDTIRARANLAHMVAREPLNRDEADPIVHVADGAYVWRLGMVESMWSFVVGRAHGEICERRIYF